MLSSKPKLLYNYFKQNFAQVTNPPIDSTREALVMSLVSMIGPRPNLLGHHAGSHYRLEVARPILTNSDLEKVRAIHSLAGDAFRTKTIDVTWPASDGAAGMAKAFAARRPMPFWMATTSSSFRIVLSRPRAFRCQRCWQRLRYTTI